MSRKRADELVLEQKLAPTRSQARALIMAAKIRVGPDRVVQKAGELWLASTIFNLKDGIKYVSRAGFKLAGALKDFNFSPQNLKVLDLGASTGGFTDCLLQNGAQSITSVDVGKGLLNWNLRNNPKVRVIEEMNCRYLDKEKVGHQYDLAVMDLSFISLDLILPVTAPLIKKQGHILAMVKPQFEVGKKNVGKGGVVRDPILIKNAVDKIANLAPHLEPKFKEIARSPSKLLGPKGNQEVFLLLKQID